MKAKLIKLENDRIKHSHRRAIFNNTAVHAMLARDGILDSLMDFCLMILANCRCFPVSFGQSKAKSSVTQVGRLNVVVESFTQNYFTFAISCEKRCLKLIQNFIE